MSRTPLIVALLLALVGSARAAVWRQIDTGAGATAIGDLYFHDADHGILVCGPTGVVLLTSDGGENWFPPTSPPSSTSSLTAVDFGDPLRGIIVGNDGLVWWTVDGGEHWTPGDSGTLENLAGVAMFDSLRGLTVGWGGLVLRTADGGASWTPLDSGTAEPLWDVSALDSTTAVVVGDFTILRTMDGGDSWSEISFPTNPHCIPYLYGVDFADSLHGLAVGDCLTILRTQDGGLTWTLQNSSTDDAEFFLAVSMRDTTHALAVGWFDGGQHNALRSSDGGLGWEVEPTGYDRSLRSVWYREDLLIAGGLSGLVFKAEDTVAAPPPNGVLVLLQNRPNPFNPATSIVFDLPVASRVRVDVYDSVGRHVVRLLDEALSSGHHGVLWHGRNELGRAVASGVYHVRVRTDRVERIVKAALVR